MAQTPPTISFAEKLGNFADKAALVFKTVLGVLILCVACIVLLPFALIYWTIFFNPASFWMWAMLHPRSAANSLSDRGTNELLAPVHEFLWALNRKFRGLLPWRSRKEFIWATQMKEASTQEQLLFFRKEGQLQEEILKNNWLSAEAKAVLFTEIAEPLLELMLPTMGKLTLGQFSFLVGTQRWNLVYVYISKYTLSEQMWGCLLKAAKKHEGDENNKALQIVCYYAQYHGLGANLINYLYADMQQALLTKVEASLESFRQRSMVKSYAYNSDKWKLFLEDLGEAPLFVENQELMTISQYKAYYLKGKKLSDGAIIFFLSQEDMEMAELVLRYEVKNNGLISNNIKSLIAAQPALAKIFLELN